MSLRKLVIHQYLPDQHIHSIVGRVATIHLPLAFKMLCLLALLAALDRMMIHYTTANVTRLFSLCGLALLGRFIVWFLNQYLDSMVITSDGISIFWREGLLEYKTEIFTWSKIETLSYSQNTLMDKIFNKWDVVIVLNQDVEFPFENIPNPKKVVQRIINLKHEALSDRPTIQTPPKPHESDPDKIRILAEVLGEVIQEYTTKQ